MQRKFLVRQYIANKDKDNTFVESFEIALKKINKTEKDIYTKVNWLNYTDFFFIGTKDYIRQIN